MERPAFVTNEHLSYLDDLRELGITNMFGSGPYLVKEFALSEKEAREALVFWMDSFNEEAK